MQEIEDYLEEKAKQIKLEKLLAWQQFYLDCNNEYLATRVGYQIEKL